MGIERTLGIVKPDAVAKGAIGGIVGMIEKTGLRVIAMRMSQLSDKEAEGFYDVHKARPFFKDLVKFMTSGPCVLMVLEGEGAIAGYRELMGPTDSKKAPPGTIRGQHGSDIERNAVHGSDGPGTAPFEIGYFFRGLELP